MPNSIRSNTMPQSNSKIKQSLKPSPRVKEAHPAAGNGERTNSISDGIKFHVDNPTPEDFLIDKDFYDLLRGTSPYFIGKLEEHERVIALPKFSLQNVQDYKDWLHARRIAAHPKLDLQDTKQWRRMCQNYLLGKHLQDHDYCNAMVDVLRHATRKVIGKPGQDLLCSVEHVFSSTSPHSPICKLFLDIAIYHWKPMGFLPPELLKSLPNFTPELCDRLGNPTTRSPFRPGADTCAFHYHTTGHTCEASNEQSLWTSLECMADDWAYSTTVSVEGINNSLQAFRTCISSTYIVLKQMSKKCKAAWAWCRRILKAQL